MTRSVHCEFNCITVGRVRLRIHRFLFTNQATTAGQRWSCYTVNILSIPFLTQPLNNIIFSKEICYRQPNRKKERKKERNNEKKKISEPYRVREGRSERDNRFLGQLFFFSSIRDSQTTCTPCNSLPSGTRSSKRRSSGQSL